MEGILTSSKKEQKRSMGLNEMEKGKMGLGKAAEILGISIREGCS
jgi:predicted HTH domain antitoxin